MRMKRVMIIIMMVEWSMNALLSTSSPTPAPTSFPTISLTCKANVGLSRPS
ncbi:hypothetical protein LguiB_032574 [Lonicera macranthoides]